MGWWGEAEHQEMNCGISIDARESEEVKAWRVQLLLSLMSLIALVGFIKRVYCYQPPLEIKRALKLLIRSKY